MNHPTAEQSAEHPFIRTPHRTLLFLSLPVFFSMTAEPLTGLVDTVFVARLGAAPQAALGVGTAALSSLFWIFNFLGVGTQTEVAQALGQGRRERAGRMWGIGLVLAGACGLLMLALGWPLAPQIATLLGATGDIQHDATTYMRVRLLSAPAMLTLLMAFGALRGVQDMRTPLWIAVTINLLNMGLDALLVLGYGPIPALGIVGVAAASAVSQWLGALWAIFATWRQLGWPAELRLGEARRLIKIGGDLFIRTGLLTLYLLFTTRIATRIGADAGAAHQAIRQMWLFTALGLDALAVTAQSLVGYFLGANALPAARRVATVACFWSVVQGVLIALGMLVAEAAIATILVPATAVAVFLWPWRIAALIQPINALAFVTDGIHWGTGDFAFLRNAMIGATAVGAVALALVDQRLPQALAWVWLATVSVVVVRALFGLLRIWPGIGESPLRPSTAKQKAKTRFSW